MYKKLDEYGQNHDEDMCTVVRNECKHLCSNQVVDIKEEAPLPSASTNATASANAILSLNTTSYASTTCCVNSTFSAIAMSSANTTSSANVTLFASKMYGKSNDTSHDNTSLLTVTIVGENTPAYQPETDSFEEEFLLQVLNSQSIS